MAFIVRTTINVEWFDLELFSSDTQAAIEMIFIKISCWSKNIDKWIKISHTICWCQFKSYKLEQFAHGIVFLVVAYVSWKGVYEGFR